MREIKKEDRRMFFISPLDKIQKSLLRSRSRDKKKRKDDKASSAFAVIVVDGMRTWSRALIKIEIPEIKNHRGIYKGFQSAKSSFNFLRPDLILQVSVNGCIIKFENQREIIF